MNEPEWPEKPDCRGPASRASSSSSQQGIGNRVAQEIKTWIEEWKQFVFQSSGQVLSWLGLIMDAGRVRQTGLLGLKRALCSSEKCVQGRASLSYASVTPAFKAIIERRKGVFGFLGKKWFTAGTEKCAFQVNMCALTCRSQSGLSHASILGNFRPPDGKWWVL